MILRSFRLLFIGLVAMGACDSRPAADLIISGGKVYTVDERQPVVESVAVRNGRIIFAGSKAEGEKYRGSETRVIDLGGRTMTPGFIESHGHMMGIGYGQLELDLSTAKNFDELVELVRDAAAKASPGEWITGRGWHQDKWDRLPERIVKGFQTHHPLSSASPDNPVFLWHASGHAAMANARAMEIAGVSTISRERSRGTQEGEGGEIIRDELGNPTGIFNERAMGIISRHIPDSSPERDEKALREALALCVRNGITSFHDAGSSQRDIDLFKKFKSTGELTVRVYAMLGGPRMARQWFSRGPEIDSTHRLTIRSVKLSCDGALGSRGAWLLESYSDRPGFNGMATLPMDTVLAISREALKHGFQVCSHAIGDRANREVLDRYEIAFRENPEVKDHRFRIEHAQHLHPDDIPRFAKLGVIPAMQAIHMSSDRPWAIDRLGAQRIKEGAYVWQSLLQSGARIANGTDAPVEPLNPIPSFYASVTRKTLRGTPEGGFEPEQKMTREQALKSYTLDAAYAGFQDEVLGSIEVGKVADFVVFSRDIMTVPEEELLDTTVAMTIIGGNVVFSYEDKDKGE